MMANSRLLLALVGAASAVNVRFTADFPGSVYSTSSSSCRGGAYRAYALAASTGLRIDGGGVAAACGSTTLCAQVFASMGYNGWALNADDIASSSLNTFINTVGSKPVASNYATGNTVSFANLGDAVLLAVSSTSSKTHTYRGAIAVALAEARDAGIDFETTPVILSVNGISDAETQDILGDETASGASDGSAAILKLAAETTDVDLVITTGISGLSDGSVTYIVGEESDKSTNWAGDRVYVASLGASSSVQQIALGFANGVPSSATRTSTSCSSYDTFVDGMIRGTVDTVRIGMLCDSGTAAREECDAGRAAIDAINNKNDGYFDDLLPLTKLEVTVAFFDQGNCGDTNDPSAYVAWTSELNPVSPVAVVGPGGSTCLKSVASVDARSSHGSDALVMSESSTATSISDRFNYPNIVRLSSSERLVMESLSVVTKHYGWNRIAVVYDAADAWASDAARIFSEKLGDAGGAVLGDTCVSSSCRTLSEAGSDLKGVRFDESGGLTASKADDILDALDDADARIVYVAAHPADQSILFERIKQTQKLYGTGYAWLSGWLSEDIFMRNGEVVADAIEGARGLILAKEKAATSGTVRQSFVDQRATGLDDGVCTGALTAGKYCDLDEDPETVGGYGPQVVDTVYTLAKGLDSLGSSSDRQNPDRIYDAVVTAGAYPGFQSFSGTVVLDGIAERQGSLTIMNLQLVTSSRRRLGVPLSSTTAEFVAVGRTVGGQFLLDAEVLFPGGTNAVPLDHDPADSDGGKGQVPMGLIYGLIFGLFLPILCCIGLGFYLYRRKKIDKSRKQKATIQQAQDELQAFKESVVNMRVVIEAAAPGGGAASNAPPAVPAKWYWEESVARLQAHAVVKPPHWIPYDDQTSAQLEAARAKASVGGSPVVPLSAAYHADVLQMKQTNTRTGFSRALLRDAPPPPKASAWFGGARDAAPPPPPLPADIDADERICLVCDVGAILQLAKQRDDGWAFGSVVMEGEGAVNTDPGYGWNRNQGWFQMEKTDVPTTDQLTKLQESLGGGGTDALATPKYWDDVKDPTVVEYFRLDPRSAATRDEYNRCLDAFMLTLDRSKFRIHSIDRVQNISLWQSYAVKKAATCAKEDDPDKAARKYVRAWLFHGCPSDVVPKILQQGFNRSFCGKNATLYGKGVYFARDASYSTFPLYCAPDAQGVQTIFLVRAVVGQWSKGEKDALTPAIRDVARNMLYDCTVDNVRDPSIFVTYHDAQAYPEYMIKFSQTTQHTGDSPCGNQPVS